MSLAEKLSEHLKVHLARLRSDPLFHEILKAIDRTRIRPFVPNTDREKATDSLIYASGKIAGERDVIVEVLGYDPNDRPAE